MIMVREVFIAKPGNASKMATWMKANMPGVKVMTDLTGVYNKVVVEMEYDSVAAWETEMKKYMEKKDGPEKTETGQSYTELYAQGKREIYRIW